METTKYEKSQDAFHCPLFAYEPEGGIPNFCGFPTIFLPLLGAKKCAGMV